MFRGVIAAGLLSAGIEACGVSSPSGVGLEIRFASFSKAQEDPGGLPADLRSLKMEARLGGKRGMVVFESDCVGIGNDPAAPERHSITLDLDSGESLTVVANGHATEDCSGSPEWMGLADGVKVEKGREKRVSIYVTRRGLRLNGTRTGLPMPRAFATSSRLIDGRILIAGGFETVSPAGPEGRFNLEAACDAVIYDPGSGTFGQPISTKDCRGLHRAVPVNGKILLVGGTSEAVLDLKGQGRPLLLARPESLVGTAVLFDPLTGRFSNVGGVNEKEITALKRADAAAVASDANSVILLGGRTTVLQSPEIVQGVIESNGSWSWKILDQKLASPRTGADAVLISDGMVLVAGGNPPPPEGSPLERLSTNPWEAKNLEVTDALSVTGHSLVKLDGASMLLAGGIQTVPGGSPSKLALILSWNGNGLVTLKGELDHPRAYHATVVLDDGRFVFAGGLQRQSEGLGTAQDLEIRDQQLRPVVRTVVEELSGGSIGLAAELAPDGSVLLAGGLTIGSDGVPVLHKTAQLLSP